MKSKENTVYYVDYPGGSKTVRGGFRGGFRSAIKEANKHVSAIVRTSILDGYKTVYVKDRR